MCFSSDLSVRNSSFAMVFAFEYRFRSRRHIHKWESPFGRHPLSLIQNKIWKEHKRNALCCAYILIMCQMIWNENVQQIADEKKVDSHFAVILGFDFALMTFERREEKNTQKRRKREKRKKNWPESHGAFSSLYPCLEDFILHICIIFFFIAQK